jgi:hypothetical protein
LKRAPVSKRARVAHDFLSSRQAITYGIVAKTARDREKYWAHWCNYASIFKCDPFLTNEDPLDCINIVCGFTTRVRAGAFGRGRQVKVQSCTDTITAINQTIQLAGQQTPLYKAEQKYQLTIKSMIKGWQHDDPPATPQLAVPISVPNTCFEATFKTDHLGTQATGSLCIIAFFYLLQVGKYTKPCMATRNEHRVSPTCTKQFSFNDVGFYKNGVVVSRLLPLSLLLSYDSTTLKITNQKNGRMGQTVHQEATGKPNCPV